MAKIYPHDRVGQKFGHLTVREKIRVGGRVRWICDCDCGGSIIRADYDLLKSKEPGCKACKFDRLSAQRVARVNGHGLSRKGLDRLYTTWTSMRSRCLSVGKRDYPRYGGRGITICLEWDDFPTFREWAVAAGYQPGMSIDRIDNDGNYEPSNCQWITPVENTKKANKVNRELKRGMYSLIHRGRVPLINCIGG